MKSIIFISQKSFAATIYKTLIRPVATYGSQSWTLNKDTCSQIAIFERKILRRIFGAVQVGNTWRIRCNKELYDMFKEPNTESFIRISRLRRLGHVGRMENYRKIEMVTTQKIEGTRSRGRPRSRWMDCVQCVAGSWRHRRSLSSGFYSASILYDVLCVRIDLGNLSWAPGIYMPKRIMGLEC